MARLGGTPVDIGAILGYFALLWAACNPSNKCIALEASPRDIDILRRNVTRNRLERQITVVPFPAGTDQTGWGGLTLEENDRCMEVDVVRVDEVIRSNDLIAFLKVDVEGRISGLQWVVSGFSGLGSCGRFGTSR